MTAHGSNEKFISMVSKRGRRDEDVAALSGFTQKFPKIIESFSHEGLLKLTEYYKPQLVYVIEYDITSILQNMVTKNILTNSEAKIVKAQEQTEGRAGVESFINNMMKRDRVVLVSLWEALAEELVRFPSPNLTRILKEVTEGGCDLLQEIQDPFVDIHIKDLYEIHKERVSESTRNLEHQPSSVDPQSRAADFETQYTELMVINQYRRTYNETHHELLKTGRTHAELIQERTKEKCERVWTEQLFRRSPGSESPPHIVVVSGVAGIGKTTMIQKIMFDWARGTQYQSFKFVFLFKFRELNLLDNADEPQMPLLRLIARHYKYLNDKRLKQILSNPGSLLFIFDGLDEYKHKLDFTQRQICSNPDGYFPVHILISSLVCQTLLKGCSILITSRPTALESLDMDRVDRFAEILGFFPEQRLMYFKKFFDNADLGSEAFQYVEENTILYTMCFNPSFCWIICSVLKSHFMTPEEERGVAPRTVTELFVMFLHNILTNHRRESEDQRGILVKLGKMAYYGVANKTYVFYDKFEMSAFGLRPDLTCSFLSGFLKEILQSESTLEYTTYTFFHLTLQEFIGACYFYLDPSGDIEDLLLQLDSCKDGRFEIFTHFLVGLARYCVFKTLGEILGDFQRKTAVRILEWLKQKAEQALLGNDKSEALRVCQWLSETQNKKLIRDAIGKDLKMDFSNTTLTHMDCAVLGSVIRCCGELQELNLSKSNLTPESIGKLAPCLTCCRCVKLPLCHISCGCCEALSMVLCNEQSNLTELHLEMHKRSCSELHLVCDALRNSNCKVKKLRLDKCHLTSGCCAAISSVLCSKHSHLTELEVNFSEMEHSGVCLLCDGLKNKNYKFEKLRLCPCGCTSDCCEALSLAVCAEHPHLTELELKNINLEDSEVHQH
ncbi:NACHT, LRR and PYD domains-containing protein 3-like isoform X1 [Polypterus senegalus]|uniref:NACHT, LRR and PYD domains-containing protein 3-like isoform X1 n=1 Tax=Polypterus senegalus TaxID=55291 RepID=UPI00196460FB|nr:NACHT, LRR and PYD domains-containing protein 3-like isoform X1 [Polypterus senegalus]XP_039615822.1 NACHT, LRR and PYD domains-containing protein 3-like isoform X1 [Polypterus senegalus]